MNFSDMQPISYLKTNTREVVKQVLETHEPVAITVNGRVQAVVQDSVSFQKTQDQIAMLRIQGSTIFADLNSFLSTRKINIR